MFFSISGWNEEYTVTTLISDWLRESEGDWDKDLLSFGVSEFSTLSNAPQKLQLTSHNDILQRRQIWGEVHINCCNDFTVTKNSAEQDGFLVPSTLNQFQLSKQHTLDVEAKEE